VRAPHGLIFGRGIPPRIRYQHVVGRGEIEPEAARLEADQEQITLAGLKRCDTLRALARRSGAIEILVGDACCVERLAKKLQKVDELTEHECLVTIRRELVGQIRERLHLGADDAEVRTDEPRITGRAAQPSELGEDVQPSLPSGFAR
jgi:hypothetical protein